MSTKPKDKCRSCPLARVAGDNARKAAGMDALSEYFKEKADNAINERDALQIQNEALHKALAANAKYALMSVSDARLLLAVMEPRGDGK